MALPGHFFDSPANDTVYGDNAEHSPLPKPLSGPGTTRQARRLQLRNAGFRGAAVPSRKVTPKSMSETSSRWSSMSGVQSGSDAENMSPSGGARGHSMSERRRTNGILQDIGNGTLPRPKSARPRVTSGKFFDPHMESYDAAFTSPMSPPAPKSSIRAKSAKTRTKASVKGRRSVSGEARLYIDHLEAELAAAQSQLSVVNSPSVTREQSSKLRTLQAETRQLQEDLEEWETKYEHRVQEEVDRHQEVEAGLRTQVRKMEDDAAEAKYRVEELEAQLAAVSQTLEATETANVNLEKRLEIMSELLAASPTKIDLHAESPWVRRKHQRPKSMLPRFPTASSLMQSPERHHESHASSPLLTFTDVVSQDTDNRQARLSINTSFSQSDTNSEIESVFSDAPATGDSMTSVELVDSMAAFNPWTTQAVQNARSRPTRRMRRFGAGSLGPKPLILPSTAHCEQAPPVSAPPLERSETTPAFAFPFPEVGELHEEEESPSSLMSRRRASTTADQITLANLAQAPFLQLPQHEEISEDSLLGAVCPLSSESQATTKDFSSLGSAAGRNLMEELCAARINETTQSSELLTLGTVVGGHVSYRTEDSAEETTDEPTESSSDIMGRRGSHTVTTQRASNSCPDSQSKSMWDRLRIIFSDCWRSPALVARHLIHAAQSRMRLPDPLRNVQWWLVGVLLGPMARRKMLHSTTYHIDGDESCPLLLSPSPDGALVYGTMYQTPPRTSPKRMALTNRRRGGKSDCDGHHRHQSKHSPWMWLRLSITLAFAVGVAFKSGPASLLKATTSSCDCDVKGDERRDSATSVS